MEKSFFDVFSKIHIDNSFSTLLDEAKVLRISANRDKTKMRLYLQFTSPVPKRSIRKLEEVIKEILGE